MATPTNYIDRSFSDHEFQRTLIQYSLKISYFFDKIFRPKALYQYEALLEINSLNAEQRLQSLKSLKQRTLIKWAFVLHAYFDSSRLMKEWTYTFFLWSKFSVKKIIRHKDKDFKLWIEKIEPQEIEKIQSRKVSFSYLALTVENPTFESLLKCLEEKAADYVVLQLSAGHASDNLYKAVDIFLAEHPEAEILFGDEDTQELSGERKDPEFRFSWCIDRFYADDFLSHFSIYKTSFLLKVIQQNKNSYGPLKYNLPFLAIESAQSKEIRHLPFILFHRLKKSSRSEQYQEAERNLRKSALDQHLHRLKEMAEVEVTKKGIPRVKFLAPIELPLVSCIIPIKDKVELLRNLINDLKYKTDYRNLEIIVVDNNSKESATLEYLSQLKYEPGVKVVSYPNAFNYSAINNLGVGSATGKVLALLNNDLEIINPDWLAEMVTHALRPGVGIVGAKLYYKNGFIQHAGVGVGVGPISGHLHRQNHRTESGYWNQLLFTHTVGAVTGACMVIKKDLYDKVGGFDEINLAVAYNDVDLCLRTRELGYRVVWTPFAELYHLESATRPNDALPAQVERYLKEIQYMKAKWGKYLKDDPFYNINLTRDWFDCEPRRI
ncbi:MAG: glycosyltransferase family 2 protein [Pseudomonadota bacterium]|nr:glycosyltransferase family 2 protein [Pseudomonadota bacterium]